MGNLCPGQHTAVSTPDTETASTGLKCGHILIPLNNGNVEMNSESPLFFVFVVAGVSKILLVCV